MPLFFKKKKEAFYFTLGYSWLTNNVVTVSGNRKGIQSYICMLPFSPKFPSHAGCHITLSRVPCWMPLFVISYLIHYSLTQPLRYVQNLHLPPALKLLSPKPPPYNDLQLVFLLAWHNSLSHLFKNVAQNMSSFCSKVLTLLLSLLRIKSILTMGLFWAQHTSPVFLSLPTAYSGLLDHLAAPWLAQTQSHLWALYICSLYCEVSSQLLVCTTRYCHSGPNVISSARPHWPSDPNEHLHLHPLWI